MSSRAKPLMIFDGDCSFCRLWIDRWKLSTNDLVEYAPYQNVEDQFSQIPRENFQATVHLVTESGQILTGAEAVFRSLSYIPEKRWLFWLYRRLPGAASVSEWCYRFIARHRNGLFTATRFLWGKNFEPSSYNLTHWIFFRLLAIIYCVAFISLAVQIKGLIGTHGISPADQYLQMIREHVGGERYWHYPTLAWLTVSDTFLQSMCWGGAVVSLLLLVGFAPAIASALAWIAYVSLFIAGQEFLSFQWDILLLETGFLAIFLAPVNLFPSLSDKKQPSAVVLFLLRLLLFRLMFFSGFVKLAGGDHSWWNLSALTFHYETQPLPTPIAWHVHHLPEWFHIASCAVMFFIELGLPFLIFAPRRLRLISFSGIAVFMVFIMLTGNYTFFNLLALALCLLLLDDRSWRKILPSRFSQLDNRHSSATRFRKSIVGILALVIVFLNGVRFAELLFNRSTILRPVAQAAQWFSPFYLVNHYGLFAVMTNPRYEIVVEGSNNGATWLPYEFRYKPGDVQLAPAWAEPHQPRLDWQMWFAALGNYQSNPWFVNFCVRLLQGSQDVLDLLKTNPFPDHPPRYIRALLYEYHFSEPEIKRSTGAWWKRDLRGSYLPPISLRE